MSQQSVRYSGGSIISLVIIAVTIAVLLGIGFFALSQRSDQANLTPPAGDSSEEIATNQPAADGEAAPPATDDATNGSGATETPAPAETDQGGATTPFEEGATAAPNDGATEAPAATELPQTGAEQLLVVPMLGILGYVAVSYVASRRQLVRQRRSALGL